MKCISFLCNALFHFNLISVSFLPSLLFHYLSYFISFLPSYLFHCLPKTISLVFHCLPRAISLVFHCCFIDCPGQHHWYFIAVSLFSQGNIIGISLLFHCLPRAISLVFSNGMLGWSHDQLPKMVKKTKIVALHCSFLNLVELCSEVLPLWRYDVEEFEKHCIFFCFLHFSP